MSFSSDNICSTCEGLIEVSADKNRFTHVVLFTITARTKGSGFLELCDYCNKTKTTRLDEFVQGKHLSDCQHLNNPVCCLLFKTKM